MCAVLPRRTSRREDHETFTVTISCGRYGHDDRLAVDFERVAVVLERVRAPRRRERRARAARARRRAPPCASYSRSTIASESSARLIVSSTRFGSSTDGERARSAAVRAERCVEAHRLRDDAGLAPAAGVRHERVRELVAAHVGLRVGALRRAQQAQPQLVAVAAVAVLASRSGAPTPKPCSERSAQRWPGHLVPRARRSSSSSASAARRSRTASRTSRSWRARRAGSRP